VLCRPQSHAFEPAVVTRVIHVSVDQEIKPSELRACRMGNGNLEGGEVIFTGAVGIYSI
jgi:hypothetical protein